MKKFLTLTLSAAALTLVAGCSAGYDPATNFNLKPGTVATAEQVTQQPQAQATEVVAAEAETKSSQDTALAEARTLLNEMNAQGVGVSRAELLAMLTHHGWHSVADATYAVDNLGVNWNTQALKLGKYWVNLVPSTTRSELVSYLTAARFTSAQANYAATQLGLKDATPTPSADVTTPPVVTPTSPSTSPSQPSDNPTMSTY